MPLWRVAVRVEGAAAAAAIADLLDELTGGVAAFETREGQPPQRPPEWLVEAHAAAPLIDAALDLRLTLAAAAGGGKILDLIELPLAERDWLAENRRAFPPQRIGRFFVHGSHWRGTPPPGSIAVEIDAASAFGTGEHPSTQGCLVALDRLSRGRRFRRVRDVGTGSGILAIAAAALLRRPVVASDIDPAAVAVARHHVRRNRLSRLIELRCGAGPGAERGAGRGYELVFANILARPLVRMAGGLARITAPGGRIVLSGLLCRQEAGVLAAYRLRHLALDARIVIAGWSILVLHKQNGPLRGAGRFAAPSSGVQSGGNHGNQVWPPASR